MIRNWNEHGNLIFLHYDFADADPEGRLNPLGLLTKQNLIDGYLVHLPRGFCTHFPPLFPFLSGLLYRRFGFGGLDDFADCGRYGDADDDLCYCTPIGPLESRAASGRSRPGDACGALLHRLLGSQPPECF